MSDLILYTSDDGHTRMNLRVDGQTIWLTQAEIAELFQTTKQNVSLHAQNIFEDEELRSEATVKESLTVQTEGGRQVERLITFYNLDLILAIGFRVRSPRGTQFRQWATTNLREYIRNADVLVGSERRNADGDVGVPSNADGDMGVPKGWYSRGYLPHRDCAGLIQAITFRLADSVPQVKLAELETELESLAEDRRGSERHRRIEQWLDAGIGCCALGHPAVAKVVQDSLLHFDGERYRLLAWCVMPNHVHVLAEPLKPLATIVKGWKSFTARWALKQNEVLGLAIPDLHHLWMREYWDRYIRDDDHLRRSIDYIHNNPFKAGLCQRAEDWAWSSVGNADVLTRSRNADVLVGNRNADVLVGNSNQDADGDVGVPRRV